MLRFPSAGEYTYLGLSHGWGCDDGWFEDGVPGDPHIWSRPLGKPLGPLSRTPNGAVPAPEPHGKHGTGGWVYTRSFGNGTHVSRAELPRHDPHDQQQSADRCG